jgi:cytochrome c oxidase subunit IV
MSEYVERARTDTKMTIAAERLAVIAAITLPVTVLILMAVMSATLLGWARRQGWW